MLRRISIVTSILAIWATAACSPARQAPIGAPGPGPAPSTLRVGLYPYVPRLDQFKTAIQEAWQQVEPGVALEFVDGWDGGYKKDPGNLDVFVFDAVFFGYFRSQGWLAPLAATEIDDMSDFLPYAIEGVQDGDSYYAIPMLGCASILFYRRDDSALARVTTLSELDKALGQCTYTSQIPPDERGLMIDLAGGTTNACYYVDAAASVTGQWPVSLPPRPEDLNRQAIANLQLLLRISSFYNGTQDPPAAYQRAAWFAQGFGRALVGYTESMSAMGPALGDVDFKVLPLADVATSRPLFYSDVIGINPNGSSRQMAVKLANLMASTDVMVASTGPGNGTSAQYLMPARPSIFQKLGQGDPIYRKMYALVEAADPILLDLGPESRSWISAMKDAIRSAVQSNYTCGCDQNAGELYSQQAADRECPTVCASWGGWSGQWRTQETGESACGCKSCSSSAGR
jgi:thiamine pyridinylase